MFNVQRSLIIDHRSLIFQAPQVRRLSAREPRQAPAGSSAKRCRDSLRGAWGILLGHGPPITVNRRTAVNGNQRQSILPGAARGGTVTVRYCRIPLAMAARVVVPAWSGFSVTVPAALSC